MPANRCVLLSVLVLCCLEALLKAAEDGPAPRSEEDKAPQPSVPPHAEPQFALKVLVRDLVTRQPLLGASVDIYINHTLRSSTPSGRGGEVLLSVPYSPDLSLTLLATMEGYVPTPLPWRTSRRPLFSSVTLLLLPHTQGNIWLFEDSLLITGKLPDSSSQPSAKFPKNLLGLSEKTNVSSLAAYLTVPQRHLVEDCGNCTPGVISTKSVYRSADLKPVAALSALLYSGGVELQVRGPIQLTLPLSPGSTLRPADTVPAWAFNANTGAFENQGLGIVKMVGNRLAWTYTASHLGYWVAAPLPSPNNYSGHSGSIDFVSYHNYMLLGIYGATLAIVVGFLSLLLCHCGGSRRAPRRRSSTARFSKLTVVKKDQTTSTHMEEGLLFHPGESSLASRGAQCDPSSTPRHKANYNIYVEDPGARPAVPLYENVASDRNQGPQTPRCYFNGEEVVRLREKSEQNSDLFFQDKLVHIYNQPVAAVQAPNPHTEPADTQSLPKAPHSQSGNGPQQSRHDEPQALETPPPGQGPNAGVWGRYNNLLESSVSVPGTLNEAAGMGGLQGISERTLLELTRGKCSSSHPRAWFVSLDGKPAPKVRHSIIELQSHHRPTSSNDTSLDSGVDMNEPQHGIRERPSVRASSLPHPSRRRYCDEQDLSSSESGTTATCTPEDPALRNILDGSIPEERDGADTSSESRGTPPPQRLRKAKDKGGGRTEKRSAKGGGGRALAKQT